MKPLINLKSFLAVLLILIVPAALLVAYFRNYSSEAPAHEHGEKGKGEGAAMKMEGAKSGMKSGDDSHAAMGHGNMAKGGDKGAMKPSGDSHAAMGHDTRPKPPGGQTQPAEANGHKHETTISEPSAEKIPLPTTLDGVWKAIHAYYGELESAVNARQFGEAQSGAKTIGALAKKLVEVAPADRKPVVEGGVTKINQALDEIRSSAETGSDSVLKTRFKEFEQALEQLEQQMRKP